MDHKITGGSAVHQRQQQGEDSAITGTDRTDDSPALPREQTADSQQQQGVIDSQQQRSDDNLNALLRTTQQLFRADSEDEIASTVVTAASEIIELPISGLFRYDETNEVLTPVEACENARELLREVPTFESGEGVAWQVFESGEPAVYDDVTTADAVYNPETPIRTEIVVPVGSYGVFLAGSTAPAAFDDRAVSLATLLAANAGAALSQLANQQALEETTARLARQNNRLEEFASIVSHDLRNPLSVAKAGVTVAKQTGETEPLQKADRAHDRMETLIDDLLRLARTGQTVNEEALEEVSLNAVSTRSWATVPSDGSELDCVENTTIVAHESRFQQLLENLLRNSVDHGGEGVTVRVGSLEDGFYVEDDGPGIPEAAREKVFEPGFTTQEQSTGLGLDIVSSVVSAHGWSISVSDSDAGGARFEITGVETAPDKQ